MNSANHIFRLLNKSGFRLIWCFIFVSCLSPTEFPTDRIAGRLVVSGQVSPIADQNFVQLGLTAEKERLPFPLSGAVVQLFDDKGMEFIYVENLSKPGNYFIPDFSGVPGTTYKIVVNTPEGETYESLPERMPESAGQLDTYFDFETREYTDLEGTVSQQPFINIYANASLPTAEVTFVKWGIEETFLLSPTDFPDPFGSVPPPCFVSLNADPQRITLFNGDEIKAETLNGFLVGSRVIDWTFQERHYFTTYQSTLTREAHDYWRKVNILANQVGSIFDTPPSEITGNVRNVNESSEKVLGYFQATNQVFTRIFLIPSDLPFALTARGCKYDASIFPQDYPPRCLNCLSVPNSSYDRPDWF